MVHYQLPAVSVFDMSKSFDFGLPLLVLGADPLCDCPLS